LESFGDINALLNRLLKKCFSNSFMGRRSWYS